MSRRIGPYTVHGELGAGAMGRVFLGRSPAGRLFAIKTIRADLADDPEFRTRFRHEVAAARRVAGAYTAPVVAADPDADTPWLATAYIPVPNLRKLVRTCGPLPVPAVRWLAAGCAEALESIHSAGLVHRDLKPSNVLVSLDGPRVIDFGVARAAERAALTLASQPIGTPSFMAPEQAGGNGRPVTPAADVFALGSTLVYAATGHAPYEGEAVLARLLTEDPDLSGLPPELTGLILACLDRDPGKRPSPAELIREMVRFSSTAAGEELGRSVLPVAAAALIAAQTGPDEDTFTSVPSLPSSGGRAADTVPGGVRIGWRGAAFGGAGVALLALGGLVGALLGASGETQDPGSPEGRQPYQQPQPGGMPPGGLPPEPPSGQDAVVGGERTLTVNQPMGDVRTTFVLHGTGWIPGERLTVKIRGKVSPARPPVDNRGTFNYAVNQSREFWKSLIPLGRHVVTVTGREGARTIDFMVNP